MIEAIERYFDSGAFMPHGHCYLWQPALVWLQVASNSLIGLAYVAISVTLAVLVKKGEYVPFKGMALAFGVFIVACGLTHFSDVLVIWQPQYWLDGGIRAITAVASVATALLLPPLIPRAIALARGAKAAREHGIELESALHEVGQMYERTRELERLKTQFFANVSHELRTPLALVLGPAEKLAAAENLTSEQRRDLEVVLRNGRTLLKHVNDLLDTARLEAGKLQPSYAEADLAQLVRWVAGHFEGLAAERGIPFAIEAPASLQAQLDPDKIERVLLNLLSNAFKFSPPGARIRCSLRALPGGRAAIEVADGGPGVHVEDRRAIFDRFAQVERSGSPTVGGTGLGLAIARDFVVLHGGTVAVGDAPEGGALFRIELPLEAPASVTVRELAPERGEGPLREAAVQALDELRARVEAVAATGEAERPLVLVVEDNPEMNRFVCETLAGEYRVEAAFDGEAALDKALSLEPDLIVTDIMMPRLSGDRLIEEIRRHDRLANVPVLVLTAKADDELRVRLLREGGQDYVTKPFSVDELCARAANLVTMKRVRDLLQHELESQTRDLERLAREVTHRKRELETALDAMRVAREHAEHASQLKTNFLSLVSHELRSPLATLKLQLERLQIEEGAELEAGTRELVRRMGGSADRLQALIDGLLDYVRIQSGRLRVEVEELDAAALAREAVEEVRPQAEARGLSLEMIAADSLPALRSDPRLVRLMLVNLLGNAVKFTQQGGVTLTVDAAAGEHRLAVRDTGPGIAPEHRMRIFEPFEQLEPVRSKHLAGVGLGLTLVREMAVGLGGSVAVESEPGRGSTFTIVLPEVVSEALRRQRRDGSKQSSES